MIRAENVTKVFDGLVALDHVSTEIADASIFGLIGSNGSGKSTFLRILSGVLRPDEGKALIDEQQIFENVQAKQQCFFISDEQHFLNNSTPDDMKSFYKKYYPNLDEERYVQLMDGFGLDRNRKIYTFSKGMKKQASIILGLSLRIKYLFCDETFDGLDPVIRQAVKGLLAADAAERGLTPIIASHNLHELEDICNHIGLLHRGGILLSRELNELKLNIFKIQCIFPQPVHKDAWKEMDILQIEQRGSLYILTARGQREQIQARIEAMHPTFLETLPLSLEEILMNETEVVGYDIKKILF